MTPEERDDLLRNAPPEEGLEAKYEHLLHAFEEQGRIMKKGADMLRYVAHWLRDAEAAGVSSSGLEICCDKSADELDPIEPLAEADAAEKFSQDAASRKPTASSPPSDSEPPST